MPNNNCVVEIIYKPTSKPTPPKKEKQSCNNKIPCGNKNYIKNNKVLITHDDYKRRGVERHTQIIKDELDADVCFINSSIDQEIIKFSQELVNEYGIIIWQNSFHEITNKNYNQIYVYVVHTQCDWWRKTTIEKIRKNDKYINYYVFVSESTKQNFEKNVLKVDNYYIIENKIGLVENDKDIQKGLCISCGSYSKLKNHHQLIREFEKLDKNEYSLEIYGEVQDPYYFRQLNSLLESKSLDNINLFEYADNYIEILKRAEYFIIWSKSEGCSYAMLEAMMLKKKIICSEESVSFNGIRNYPNKLICKNGRLTKECFGTDWIDCIQAQTHYVKNTWKDFLFSKTVVLSERKKDILQKMSSCLYDMYKISSLTDDMMENISDNINSMSDFLSDYKSILFVCCDFPGYGGAATNCDCLQHFFSKNHKTFSLYYDAKNQTENDRYRVVYKNELQNEIEKIIDQFDVIVLKSHVYFDIGIYKKPIIYLIPGLYDNTLDKHYYNLSKSEHEKYILKYVVQQIEDSDYVFVNSSHTKQILKDVYDIDVNIFYSTFVPFYGKKLVDYGDISDRKYKYGIIVSDFRRKIKNIRKCVQIIEVDKDENKKVILIGKNSESFKRFGYECIDFLEHDRMNDIYKDIQYIVQDSFYESCSNARIESMFSGCSIISE